MRALRAVPNAPALDLDHNAAVQVPDLLGGGEPAHRHDVGERLLDRRDPHVLPVGSDADALEHRRPADPPHGAAVHVDQRELARDVVLQQLVLVRRLEQVRERA